MKSAGLRYFIPPGFEEQICTALLKNQIDLIRKVASLPEGILAEKDTRQLELITSLRGIFSFAINSQKIHNKTYCLAGLNLVFSSQDDPNVMKEYFFTLPCFY